MTFLDLSLSINVAIPAIGPSAARHSGEKQILRAILIVCMKSTPPRSIIAMRGGATGMPKVLVVASLGKTT